MCCWLVHGVNGMHVMIHMEVISSGSWEKEKKVVQGLVKLVKGKGRECGKRPPIIHVVVGDIW